MCVCLSSVGVISFNEYIACLSLLSNKATKEEKLKCTHITHTYYILYIPHIYTHTYTYIHTYIYIFTYIPHIFIYINRHMIVHVISVLNVCVSSFFPAVWLRLWRFHQCVWPHCHGSRNTQVTTITTTLTLIACTYALYSCRENDVVIARAAVESLVLATMSGTTAVTPNCINFDEYAYHIFAHYFEHCTHIYIHMHLRV